MSHHDPRIERFLEISRAALGLAAATAPECAPFHALHLTDMQRHALTRILREHQPVLRARLDSLANARTALKVACARPRVTSAELNAAADAITAANEALNDARASVMSELRQALAPDRRTGLDS